MLQAKPSGFVESDSLKWENVHFHKGQQKRLDSSLPYIFFLGSLNGQIMFFTVNRQHIPVLWFLQMHTNEFRRTDMGRNVLRVHILVTVIHFFIANTWLELYNNRKENKQAKKTTAKTQ